MFELLLKALGLTDQQPAKSILAATDDGSASSIDNPHSAMWFSAMSVAKSSAAMKLLLEKRPRGLRVPDDTVLRVVESRVMSIAEKAECVRLLSEHKAVIDCKRNSSDAEPVSVLLLACGITDGAPIVSALLDCKAPIPSTALEQPIRGRRALVLFLLLHASCIHSPCVACSSAVTQLVLAGARLTGTPLQRHAHCLDHDYLRAMIEVGSPLPPAEPAPLVDADADDAEADPSYPAGAEFRALVDRAANAEHTALTFFVHRRLNFCHEVHACMMHAPFLSDGSAV